MNDPFVFYRALDPLKGSWDGYGYFSVGGDQDFIAYVTDAPSTASVHTPELIHEFWAQQSQVVTSLNGSGDFLRIEFADAMNRLQDLLQRRSRHDGSIYQATLSVAWKSGDRLLYCAVGDSTLQIFRNGRLYRLSLNEVWDGALIMQESGQYKERQKTGTPEIIGNGGPFFGASRISTLNLKSGDLLLFNTDGLEDLLPPDRLIGLLNGGESNLRKELERLFAAERLKDDVTLMAVNVQTPDPWNVRDDLGRLQTEIQKTQSNQTALRKDIDRIAAGPQERLEKIERMLQQLSQQLQKLSKAAEPLSRKGIQGPAPQARSFNTPKSANATRNKPPLPWLLLITVFLVGLISGLSFFLWNRPAVRSTVLPKPQATQSAQPAKSIPTPESTNPADCSYMIAKGDTLEGIAVRKNITVDTLLQLNPEMRKSTALRVGDKLVTCREGL